MDLLDFYYRDHVGHYPDNEEDARCTQRLLAYLSDCGFSEKDIVNILDKCGSHERLTPEMLPDALWLKSLVKRNHFYYHHALQLVPPPPRVKGNKEIIEPFYREIRILFTIKDLIDYFYRTLNIDLSLRDDRHDGAQFSKMLNDFARLRPIEPLDFVLALIDYAKVTNMFIAKPFDLENGNAVADTLDKLKRNMAEAKLKKADRIVWRK